MKIWIASLQVFLNFKTNKYETGFYFEEEEEDYIFDENLNEWVFVKRYLIKRIPKDMKLKDNNTIIQGFDRKLNDEELKEVELNMRKMLEEKLREEFSRVYETYNKKLKAVIPSINEDENKKSYVDDLIFRVEKKRILNNKFK